MTVSATAGRLARLFFMLFIGVAAQPALATINCEILASGATSLAAQTNGSLTVNFSVSGLGCGTVTTNVAVISDTTGSSVTPTSITGAAGTRTLTVATGPSAGTFAFRVTCATGCFGFPSNTTIDYTVSVTAPVMSNLTAQGPTTFTALTGTSQVITVRADDSGTPANTTIRWTSTGPVSLSAASTNTDATGSASVTALWGPGTGAASITATRIDNVNSPVLYSITVQAPPVRTLVAISGNNQSAPTRTALPNPLVIEARDNGNPAPAIGIRWSVVSGDATLVAAGATTDAGGRAQTGLQFGATAGPVVVRASRVDDPAASVDFTVTATFNRTIAIVSGANQQGLPGLPLPNPIVIEVRGNGTPEPGVTVDISVGGDATVSGDGTATAKLQRVTGPDGRVSATVTLGPNSSGVVSILASVPASPGVSTTANATASSLADLPGLPEPLRELGGVLQRACSAIARIAPTQRTAEQSDLLARCQSFAGANPGQVAVALDELLPDTTLAMVTVALQAGQAQLDNLKARIAALRSGTQGSKFGGLAIASPTGQVPVSGLLESMLGANGSPEAGADFDRWGWFVSGTLGRGEVEAGRVAPSFDFDINGLTAGVDYRFSDRFVAGGSVGYTRQDTALTGAEGNVDADGYSLSAYATFYREQSWYSDAVLTWGRNDYETLRRIRYTLTGPGGTSSIDQTARARHDGDLLSIAGTVGRDYQVGRWNLGPYGRLLYSRIDFDAGREVIAGGPGSGFALEVFPGEHTSFASVAGAKFSTALSRDWGILMPHLQVEWEREYRDDPQRVGARFLADPNAARFGMEGDPIDNSFFRIGGGFSVLLTGGRSGFVYVERLVGKSGFTQTNVALGLRGEF